MKNNLENLELKFQQTRRENAEKLDKIETEFKKEFGDFLNTFFLNDNLGFKRFVNVAFQLEKLDNPGKNNKEVLKNSFKKALEILPLSTEKKQILETKFFNLLDKNISLEKIFLKNNDLRKDYNYPILEALEKHQILDKNDLIKVSLKYKETHNFLDSISILSEEKKEVIKNNYYELNDSKSEKRQKNFEHDFKQDINNSKILKIYPKILKFIGKNYFRLKLKNKVESKKDKLKRLYKIIFLKLYRLKYSGIDIDKIIQKIETISDFEEFLNLLIKYFEVLKRNPKLQKDYIVSEEVDEVNNLETEAEENKEKILLSEKNTIKVNEIFEEAEKKLTQNDLDVLLDDNVDLIGNEFMKRYSSNSFLKLDNSLAGIYNEENLKNTKLDKEQEEDFKEVDLEEYYEKLKEEYEEIEKKKSKLFLNGEYDELDEINDELLKLLKKLRKVEVLLGLNDLEEK